MATFHNGGDNGPVPDLPKHWDFGGGKNSIQAPRNPLILIRQILCLICFGYPTLVPIWESSHNRAWRTTKENMRDRIHHVTILATILLATISAFCTTEPPANSRILPYTKPVPYCLLLASMGSSLAGVTVGSLCIAIVHRMEPLWFREVLMGSARRIWITMIILCVQFFSTTVSLLLFASGLIVAAASSEIPVVKFGFGFFALPLFVTLVALSWFVTFRPGMLERLLVH